MEERLNFSYDPKSPDSWRRHFIDFLDDLKHDKLTDEDVAKAFAEFNLSDRDFKELVKLFDSAHVKQQKIVWVDKKSMAESLGISEKTLERFKADHEGDIEVNVHIKKLDKKTQRYHLKNFGALYHEIKDKEDWSAIIDNTGKDWKLDADGKPVVKKGRKR